MTVRPVPRGDFVLRAHPGVVELSAVDAGTRILQLSSAGARLLARNLELYAERADILTRDENADLPREGVVAVDSPSPGA